jgi:hypothetical protein
MDHHAHREHHTHGVHGADAAHPAHDVGPRESTNWRLALSATLHCLLGCALGEIIGMAIAMAIGMSNVSTIALTVTMGFVFGLALGMIPLIRARFTIARALRQVVISEALSIAVMEGVEVLVAVNIPGAMDAHVTHPLFWSAMALGLAAGFVGVSGELLADPPGDSTSALSRQGGNALS